jgi:hypothetical protein
VEILRIYVDTSVLGGCFDSEFSTWSLALVRDSQVGRMVPVLSDVTAAEVVEAPDRVRELHEELLGIAGSLLPMTEPVLQLAAAYEERKILPRKSQPTCGTLLWPPSQKFMHSSVGTSATL